MSTMSLATSEFGRGHEARQPARPRGRPSRLAMLALAGTALVALGAPTAALAQSLVLSGDYVRVGVNNKGTLGTGGNVRPGILYDGSGTGTFNPNYDYLTPGSPMEGFVLQGSSGAGAFTATNNNASLGSVSITGGVLTSYNGVAYRGATYDQRAVWTGIYGSVLSITNDYHFNTHGQQLSISTTITALTNLTALTFTRFEDPDAVAAPGDRSATNNFRGSGAVPATDLVYAEALVSKYVIGFYSADPTPHNTGVPGFTANPAGYLAGTFLGNGDYTIGMGFTIGSLLSGASITLNYSYIFGTDIAAALAASSADSVAAAPPPTNILADSHYTVADLGSGSVNPVFDGGVLTLGSTDVVALDLTVMAAGGGIDTAGHDLTLTGAITGDGRLSKLGDGVLTLTGVNSFNGLTVGAGVLAFGSDTSLGAAGSTVTVANGAGLRALSDLTMAHRIEIGSGAAAFDTQANTVTLSGDVTGGGTLLKAGSGTLTLAGHNSQSTLDIQQGVVIAGAQAALGAADGKIVLRAGSGFAAADGLTITQAVEIAGPNTRFDTGAHQLVLTGPVTGEACFTKVGSGLLDLVGPGSNAVGACVQEGKMSFNNVFVGAVYVDPGATAGGGGLIAGPISVRGTLSPGNSPGRLVVAGSVTQFAGSSLALDIDGPTPGVGAGHYDTLILTGAGSVYTAAGSIAPITRGITGAAGNSYSPRIGDTFQVVTAEGGVTGAFAQVVQPTTGLAANTRLEVVYTDKSVIIAVTPDRYAALATGSRNAQAVAVAADSLRATGANSFTSGLVGLNEGQLAGVLQVAAGEIHADGLDAVQQANRAVRAQVSERMYPRAVRGGAVWATITSEVRKVGDDTTAGRYRIDRTGGIVGADLWLTPSLLIGAAASYGENRIDAGVMGSGRTFTYQGLVYAGWRSGAYYVNGVASAGSDVFKTVRSVAMASGRTTAYAKPRGHGFGGDIEAGRAFAKGPATLVLAAGLGEDQLTRNAVIEAGDAVTALRFEDATRDALQGRVGGRIQVRTAPAGFQITPYASAFVLQEFNGASSHLAASLQGAAFQVAAASPGNTSIRLALGVEAAVTQRARISLAYRYEGSRGAEGHELSLRGALAW